jgi:hypothetical protein
MSVAEGYRRLATQLRSNARCEESRWLRSEWERLAGCYVQLAEHADRNSRPLRSPGKPVTSDERVALCKHVLKTGFLIVAEKALKLECTVKDVSDAGAALQVSTSFGIPPRFDLVIDGKRRHCRLQWKTDTEVGVLFQ